MDVTFIYVLKDPVTGDVRYVGKADHPHARYLRHLREAQRKRNHRECWLCSLAARGLTPLLEVIDEVPAKEWQAWEVAYVLFYREQGADLVNRTVGGDGFGAGPEHPCYGRQFVVTAETRAKIGRGNKGKVRSPEICARISEMTRGERHPFFGKKRPPEVGAKISAKRKGMVFTAQHRANLRSSHLPKPDPRQMAFL
jgi:hypothetical protein